ncbi:protein MICROTUBULE BINDING PROTEIN 2C [Nymphaea colorata]|nr:protein MICROTUBULE BINDING PROTEIN 2C [Nymphaea colorata]XP_031479605.1 protein MICROTUBULE BINDING PROTEIN 2C [Nymphaea colorata]
MDRHFPPENSSASSPPPPPSSSNGNFDRVLFKNLVEMVPLVESLMDRRSTTSFTRRASLIYTKTPSRDANSKKMTDAKGRKPVHAASTKKQMDHVHNAIDKFTRKDNLDASSDEFSILATRSSISEKEREELILLREQVEELKRKLMEKEEELKSAEESMNRFSLAVTEIDDLKRQIEEKDSLVRSAHLQLNEAKIKLADKQAAVEKLEWEAKKSSKEADEVKNELDYLHNEIARFMRIFETSKEIVSNSELREEDAAPGDISHVEDQFQSNEIYDQLENIEIARKEYLAAVASAKENPDEESLAIASKSRLHLQSLLAGVHGMGIAKNRHAINGFSSRKAEPLAL